MSDAHANDPDDAQAGEGASSEALEAVLLEAVLLDALECELEGARVERLVTGGARGEGGLVEGLPEHVRVAALAAMDASLQEAATAAALDAVLEALLPDALDLEALELEALELEALELEALELEAKGTAAGDGADRLSAALRAVALAAWDDQARDDQARDDQARDDQARDDQARDDQARPAPVLAAQGRVRVRREEPLRARRMRAPLFLRPVAAAALLLVALGAGLWLFGSGDEAEAGLQLRALSRRDLGSMVGMSRVEPGYFATLGRVFAPGTDELLSFGLAHDGVVVVGGGDAIRVTRPDTRAPDVSTAQDAVLRLESGEARLATRDAPVLLEVDGVGLLVLEEGAAHVALNAEASGGAPAVALMEHSVARFYRRDGTSVPLVGPTRVLLTSDGVRGFGTPARSLFRELAFFGGPLPPTTQVRTVSARLFEVRAGTAARRRQALGLLASAPTAATTTTFAWRPPPVLADARTLRVALRAPTGTTVTLTQAGVEAPRAEVRRASGGHEPGLATVELTLAADWYERLADGRLELTVAVPAAGGAPAVGQEQGAPKAGSRAVQRRKAVRAWFDGIALVLGPSADGLPSQVADHPAPGAAKGVPDAKDQR